MSYTKKGSSGIFEATQLKEDSIINCGGDLHIPAGHWVVTQGDVTVECPSDAGFKENYAAYSAPKSRAKTEPDAKESSEIL